MERAITAARRAFDTTTGRPTRAAAALHPPAARRAARGAGRFKQQIAAEPAAPWYMRAGGPQCDVRSLLDYTLETLPKFGGAATSGERVRQLKSRRLVEKEASACRCISRERAAADQPRKSYLHSRGAPWC